MFKSTRFVAFATIVVIFAAMMFFTDFAPIESATALSILAGIYIVPRTVRGATKE